MKGAVLDRQSLGQLCVALGNKMASKSVKIGRCFERLGKGKGFGGRGSINGQLKVIKCV